MKNSRTRKVQNMNRDNLFVDDVKQVGKEIKGVIKAIVPGRIRDDRYDARQEEIVNVLEKAGYIRGGKPNAGDNAPTLAQFEARKEDSPSKAKSNEPMFVRLQAFVRAILNYYNPGLGDKFVNEAPFIMANLGNIKKDSVTYLKELTKTFPPGSYKPSFQEKTKQNAQQLLDNQVTDIGSVLGNSGAQQVENENVKILKPLVPVMKAGLQDAGHIAPKDIASLADDFYIKIVAPATENSYDNDHLDEAITNSILEFIATIQQKKINGEKLPTIYDKMAGLTMRVQEKLEKKGKQAVGNSIGNWIIDHPLESASIAILLAFIISRVLK